MKTLDTHVNKKTQFGAKKGKTQSYNEAFIRLPILYDLRISNNE